MFDYNQFLFYKKTALEVTGEVYVSCLTTMNKLREAIEHESNGARSVRMCEEGAQYGLCECYIVR